MTTEQELRADHLINARVKANAALLNVHAAAQRLPDNFNSIALSNDGSAKSQVLADLELLERMIQKARKAIVALPGKTIFS